MERGFLSVSLEPEILKRSNGWLFKLKKYLTILTQVLRDVCYLCLKFFMKYVLVWAVRSKVMYFYSENSTCARNIPSIPMHKAHTLSKNQLWPEIRQLNVCICDKNYTGEFIFERTF